VAATTTLDIARSPGNNVEGVMLPVLGQANRALVIVKALRKILPMLLQSLPIAAYATGRVPLTLAELELINHLKVV